MKSLKLIPYFLFYLLCVVACSENEKDEPAVISGSFDPSGIFVEQYTFGADVETQSISFYTNKNWQIESSATWCVLSANAGMAGQVSVDVKVEKNESYDERTATVILVAGELGNSIEKRINIIQKQKDALLLTSNNVLVGAGGATIEVVLQSNVEYSVEMPAVDWVHQEVNTRALISHTLHFVVDKNDTFKERSIEIIFYDSSRNLSEILTINQEAPWTNVETLSLAWDGEKRADLTYQLLVYSFADSDGDKTGDLNGVTEKLDYIQSLGASAIWLSPIHPADSYHGYDVTDYTAVNPQYGTMNDFKRLLDEAHKRDIKVYLDYVLNHTGKGHPWFTEAVEDEQSPYRDYFFFNTTGGDNYWQAYSKPAISTGVLKFTLDWGSTTKTVTVEQADAPDASEGDADLWLYYGEEIGKRFHDKGNNHYELTVDYDSDWGFLIRTNNGGQWDNNTKYGASSVDKQVTLGTPFTLYTHASSDNVQNLTFAGSSTLYYYGVFGSWMPDLNYGEVNAVRSNATYQALLASAKGWIDAGVDGFRLDAVKHIYDKEADNPVFLKQWYDDLDAYYKSKGHTDDIYMVGEALVGDAGPIAPYYAGLPAMFDFPFWYHLEWAINANTGCYFVKDVMEQQQHYASYRSDYIEATKLSNHDEDRAASKLGKSAEKCKLAAAVLLTAPGAPYIYYGEELGMYGMKTNGDEYVRGPMLWGDNMVTDCMDKVDKTVAATVKPVTEQQADENSLLNVYVNFARLRNTYPALAEGTLLKHAVYNDSNVTDGKPIAAWYMTKDSQRMLVVHNFAASAQEVSLTDAIDKAVGMNGEVQQRQSGDTFQLKMGAYSSVVFLLK